MGNGLDHAREREELGQIDYFLDQLARAVERGVITRASYDQLVPPYLERREDLVAILTARPAAYPAEQPDDELELDFAGRPAPVAGPAPAGARLRPYEPEPDAFETRDPWELPRDERTGTAGRPRREPVTVNWTTVLLFLGAFLVISASAIFALTVWGSVGTLGKLAFMGVATACFYVAGYFARTRLKLTTGSSALVAVGSAMLLFDCWIVIDGYGLSGPLPWAIAFLAISAVYWLTAVMLGQRIFVVAGAAAQVAWWWLAADGLHLEPTARLAVIAAVGVVWQVLAARAVERRELTPLAEVLLWAAPIVEVLAAVGTALAILSSVPVGLPILVAATVTAACGAFVVLGSRLVLRPAGSWIAAALQLPLFVAIFNGSGSSWAGVAFLAALAVAYVLVALVRCGAAFALLAAAAETLAFLSAFDLMHVGTRGVLALIAVLGLSWIASAWLIARTDEGALPSWLEAAEETGFTLGFLGFVPLLVASAGAVVVGNGPALGGGTIVAPDVVLAASLLAVWAAASLLRRQAVPAAGAIAWSFYALAALMAWALPGLHSAYYASVLVLLAAAWLFVRYPMQRFYHLDLLVFGWAMRGVIVLLAIGGLVAEVHYFSHLVSWASVVLALTVSAVMLVDSLLAEEPASMAVAGMALVFAADLAGRLVWGDGAGAVAAGAVAVLTAGCGWVLQHAWGERAKALVVSVALAASLACVPDVPQWWLSGALALAAVAWAVAAATVWEPLAFLAGMAGMASLATLLSAADRPGWVTIAAFGVAALLYSLPSVIPATRRGGRHQAVGLSLAVAGALGLAFVVAGGLVNTWIFESGWLDLGAHGFALALALLGAYVVAMAAVWRFEPLLYVGCFVLLLSLFSELNGRHYNTAELFSTSLALYFIGMGYLYVWWGRGQCDHDRRFPAILDLLAVVVGLGVPVVLALTNTYGKPMVVHTSWAIGLSVIAIAAGVVARSRYYLFGGTAALAMVAGWRTLSYLAEVWWLVLGVIGVAFLAIALTWERQRQFIGETRARLQRSFEDWR